MSWVGGGFWQPMFHVVDDNAPSDELDGQQFWWSRCGTMCVVIPAGADVTAIPQCSQCFLPIISVGEHPPSTSEEAAAPSPDRTVGWFETCDS